MKTYVTYGFLVALGGALLNLVLFFLGFHSDVEKLSSAQWIGGCAGLAIGVTFTVLGTRVRRTEVPASEPFGYSRALGAAVMITLFAALFGALFNFIYMQFINPGFQDVIMQAQASKLEAKGLSGAQLEQAEKMTRMFTGPLISSCFNFLGGMFFGTIISLIIAAFVRRPATPAPVAAA
ncbi:MAG TPA: DUF4199 domain-containing protein [Opitutus sp.]|nr:DUF4199 domain-containing protein [Opitutus sp.]